MATKKSSDRRVDPVILEGVRIVFRNFSGLAGRYNAEGDRNFSVLLDDDVAEAMTADGWNVKWLQPREEGDKPQARVEVAVNFKGRPPHIVLITSGGKTNLEEADVKLLDWAEIKNVDMILRPYQWDVNGKQGVKAYLKSIYVTIVEDELEKKYRDVPDSGQSAMVEEPNEDDSVPF